MIKRFNYIKDLKLGLIFKLLPRRLRLPIRYCVYKVMKKIDHELLFVCKNLLQNKRAFVDIGAHQGIYSYHLRNYFEKIYAFEPFTEISGDLKAAGLDNVIIHNIVLSNASDIKTLYLPTYKNKPVYSRASLEERGLEHAQIEIESRTLDSLFLTDVDLLKIDVEGHEKSVLDGAINTIRRTKPVIIIEVEQRHTKVDIHEIFNMLLICGYYGYFLIGGEVKSISDFDYKIHQEDQLLDTKSNLYINNFIFSTMQIDLK